jgi:hypothetical protein
MKCPICGENTRDDWKFLQATLPQDPGVIGIKVANELPSLGESSPVRGFAGNVWFDWMYCEAEGCGTLVVRAHNAEREFDGTGFAYKPDATLTWTVFPRHSNRSVDSLVPPEFARDYKEAAAILDASPRMSAVLSRSLLADLLERYAKLTDYGLNDRVDKFRADTTRPNGLREGMHHFREIGDFGAHKQKNDLDQIIEVTREDAEWMLNYLDRVLDYFIVSPERDRQVLGRWDQNIADAGRKPIPPIEES